MKKSNWLIALVLVAASAFFLWLWYRLGFNLVHSADLGLTIGWWAIVAVVCVAIHAADKKRQAKVRTLYVGPSAIFNSEAGLVPVAQGASAVDTAEGVLSNLKYGFDVADFPAKDEASFTYKVVSSKFKSPKDGAEPEWQGSVAPVAGTGEAVSFANKADLAELLK